MKNNFDQIVSQGEDSISFTNVFSDYKKSRFVSEKNTRDLIGDAILNFDQDQMFTAAELKNIIKNDVALSSIKNILSGLTAIKALNRPSRGKYQKTDVDIRNVCYDQILNAPTSRWQDENGPNKIHITDLQYKKVSKYLSGDSLILCGPNVDLRIRQSKCITGISNDLYLSDNNQEIFKLILDKIPEHTERKIKPILCNVGDMNNHVVFQDLDFCATWVNKDSKGREAGEILANRLIEQSQLKFPIAAMNFTFCMRPFKKIDAVRMINSILHILGASIKSFDNDVTGYGKGMLVLDNPEKGWGYIHKPDWLNKGRVLELDFYNYSDTSNQMITCLIIYN